MNCVLRDWICEENTQNNITNIHYKLHLGKTQLSFNSNPESWSQVRIKILRHKGNIKDKMKNNDNIHSHVLNI